VAATFFPVPLAIPLSPDYDEFMMKHLCLCLFAALVLSGALLPPLPAAAAATAAMTVGIDHALTQTQAGDWKGARATLDAIPPSPVPDALLLAARGTVELAAGNAGDADPLFRAALAQDPGQLASLWGLSLCLLQKRNFYEAAPLLDRATTIAPDDAQIKALHAYLDLCLGMTTDAALAGKAALAGGARAPFLMATLAQIHACMRLPDKAVEFGDMAAQSFHVADLIALPAGDYLPLLQAPADTPAKLTTSAPDAKPAPLPQLPTPPAEDAQDIALLAPTDGSTLAGEQTVLVTCARKPHLLALLIDGLLRGAATHAPYRFPWDAATIPPGLHHLTVRAYDAYGMPMAEASISITTTGGKTPDSPMKNNADDYRLEKRMMAYTQPLPSPLSLYTNLAIWNLAIKDSVRSIDALEIAVALDPANANLVNTLIRLYREQGTVATLPAGEVRQGPTTRKYVALTFDGGPHPDSTPAIMTVLARFDAHATFFLTGTSVEQFPALAQDLLANGQEIGNGGYGHLALAKLATADLLREVLWNRALLKEALGQDTVLYRAPDEKTTDALAGQLQALGYRLIGRTIDVEDEIGVTASDQVAHLLTTVQNGSIFRLPADAMRILPTLLTELRNHGYTCVTISRLLQK
jgi:peptidoglycan/xylan/chitin deacetylase (PgdA/CDA1 family)